MFKLHYNNTMRFTIRVFYILNRNKSYFIADGSYVVNVMVTQYCFLILPSSTCDCVIFMFLGLSLFKKEVLDSRYWHYGFILWSLLFCFVYRFVGEYDEGKVIQYCFCRTQSGVDSPQLHDVDCTVYLCLYVLMWLLECH